MRFPPRLCPTRFSYTDGPNLFKLHRTVDTHSKMCNQVLEFSKWPPFFQNGRRCHGNSKKAGKLKVLRIGQNFTGRMSRMYRIETECKENIAANNSAVGVTRNSSPQLQSTHLCITESFILGPELNWKWTAFARGEVTKDKSTKV